MYVCERVIIVCVTKSDCWKNHSVSILRRGIDECVIFKICN